MDHDAEVLQITREAFVAIQDSHPDVLARLSSAINAAKGQDTRVSIVEAAFRDAAIALLPADKISAQALFKAAETLAEISEYWSLPKDQP